VQEFILTSLCEYGLSDEAFALIDQASFDYVADPEKPWRGASRAWQIFSLAMSGTLMRDARAPRLYARLGLCDYWTQTGKWPDSAEAGVLPYDFKAACRALAGLAV
jgi:hypothetical protein